MYACGGQSLYFCGVYKVYGWFGFFVGGSILNYGRIVGSLYMIVSALNV